MHKYDIILYIKQQLHDDLYSKLAIDKHFCLLSDKSYVKDLDGRMYSSCRHEHVSLFPGYIWWYCMDIILRPLTSAVLICICQQPLTYKCLMLIAINQGCYIKNICFWPFKSLLYVGNLCFWLLKT